MSYTTSLLDLENQHDFTIRHIGPNSDNAKTMLAKLGYDSMDTFINDVIPSSIRETDALKLQQGISEANALAQLKALAQQNQVKKSLIGMGYYNTHTPSVVLRNVLENPAWYTAYTPYQAEISQGRLEAMFNFQTMLTDLTEMEIANASLLDEGTAAAEAMTMARRVNRNKATTFFVSEGCLPQTIEVVKTRAKPLGIKVKVGNHLQDLNPNECFAVLLQYPEVNGTLHDYTQTINHLHEAKALAIIATDLLSLTLLKTPGAMGADIVVGSSQRFGVPLGYGGPHAAFLVTRNQYKRSMPGRLIGLSIDSNGNPAYRMALQTREQHIRREKATSNVCTAQALLAVIASFYAVFHGAEGLKRIAQRVHRYTCLLAHALRKLGYSINNETFFDTLTLSIKDVEQVKKLHQLAHNQQFNFREIDNKTIGLSLDETITRDDIKALIAIFSTANNTSQATDIESLDQQTQTAIPDDLIRQTDYLTHSVFKRYRSETEIMRYMRRLADKDLALDRTMIPLGSCTMKLNAASEMLPITWPEFGSMHPFVPLDQAKGYQTMLQELEQMLCACTGYDAMSLQPNAGSQGEYAGLLAIQAYHESRGEKQRTICLIPNSAHGTNPASAQMTGLTVVVIACDSQGNIDINDLKAKLKQYEEQVSSIMITYPSTHGVFEEHIREVCGLVHDHGGQVYIDGANLNAQVGLCSPGHYGGDVSHLNLHKTFAIPHGGGGPGIGPIGVRAHLAPFLPNNTPIINDASNPLGGAVCSAPWGSAGVLPITWMYITMMGQQGLTQASEMAILSANYIAHRLQTHYPILYKGQQGLVAHECIIDLRPIKDATGVTVDDVAKRLMDYGFHAPTMSFPVAGTLMIEPTESESIEEMDRFCEAMIAIRQEIHAIENKQIKVEESALRHAPHTQRAVCANQWDRVYSREEAAYPVKHLRDVKYWPPVARIDNAHGDKNLICSCPSMESYQ